DATHPEETRVVVLRNGRVEEFDYESAARKPLRGNIYLAKVTRVEPSLQAAFVDYGGKRHGVLAVRGNQPHYYQIPVADRPGPWGGGGGGRGRGRGGRGGRPPGGRGPPRGRGLPPPPMPTRIPSPPTRAGAMTVRRALKPRPRPGTANWQSRCRRRPPRRARPLRCGPRPIATGSSAMSRSP